MKTVFLERCEGHAGRMVFSVHTPVMVMHAVFDRSGLAELGWGNHAAADSFPAAAVLGKREVPVAVEALEADLEDFFSGVLDASSLRVNLSREVLGGASEFRRHVWEQLRRIPRGEVVTYGELAERMGKPGAARAVGGACRANPWPILLPCHRVVSRAGPGGFGGGRVPLEIKFRLLEAEGIIFP